MSLTSHLSEFTTALSSAFKKARTSGADPNPAITTDLAKEIASAIIAYMTSADVKTTNIILPGQTATAPAFGAGVYSMPGTGTGSGAITFAQPDQQTLEKNIFAALQRIKQSGTMDNADPNSLIATLASDMKNAIHIFALSAKVETDIDVFPGVPVIGYIAGTAPLPSLSGKGTGKGTGHLL